MAYKTIVAYVDDASRCQALIEVAKALSARHEAHLVGLHVIPNVQIYAAAEAGLVADLWQAERRQFDETANAARDFFRAATKGVSYGSEWRCIDQGADMIGERVLEAGLVSDLVITGQIDPHVESPRRVGTPEHVLMNGGRPLLMVPYAGTYASVGEHVMIAWKPSGEAARAVFDALPLLITADRVTILSIDPDRGDDAAAPGSGDALAASLARHGVDARPVSTSSEGIGVGATILSRLADEGADLLVMGGYGHARFTEYLFGGATRDVLRQMTVPVLISH